MRGLLLALAAVPFLGGGIALFTRRDAPARLAGLAGLAVGGLLLLAVAAPGGVAVVVAVALSAGTLAGLLLVARAMERTASREDGTDLRIDVDPLRWP